MTALEWCRARLAQSVAQPVVQPVAQSVVQPVALSVAQPVADAERARDIRGTPVPFAGREVGVEVGGEVEMGAAGFVGGEMAARRLAATVVADFLGAIYEWLAPIGTRVYSVEIVGASGDTSGGVADWGRRACRGPISESEVVAASRWPAFAAQIASRGDARIVTASVEVADGIGGRARVAAAYRLESDAEFEK